MKQLLKHLRLLLGVFLIGTLAAVGWLPGAVQQVAAQDAMDNTVFLPLIASDSGAPTITELQNYTMAAEQSSAEVTAADERIRRLRPSKNPSYAVKVTEGVVYGEALVVSPEGEVSTTELLLDLYEPMDAPEKLRPAVILVHGGAFIRGSRLDPRLVRAGHEYASRGYVAISISYRLGGGPNLVTTGEVGPFPIVSERVRAYQDLVNSVESIRFLDFIGDPEAIAAVDPLVRLGQAAAMDDTVRALDWLEEQAESLLIDLSRLVMFGGSAGAITSIHAAYALDDLGIDAPRIAAVIDHWGAFNLDDDDDDTDGTAFMERGEAAIFIVHGTNDVEVPFTFGKAIFQRTKQDIVGIPAKFVRVKGGFHGFASIDIFAERADERDSFFQRTVLFLDDVLYEQNRIMVTTE